MTRRIDTTAEGVRDSWDFWLSQHDVSVPMTINDAVEAAFTSWLQKGAGDQIIERAAQILAERAGDIS